MVNTDLQALMKKTVGKQNAETGFYVVCVCFVHYWQAVSYSAVLQGAVRQCVSSPGPEQEKRSDLVFCSFRTAYVSYQSWLAC